MFMRMLILTNKPSHYSISLLLTNHLIPVHYMYICIIMFKLIYNPQVGFGA